LVRRRVTSYDVARAAGVSQTTVSFVLNQVAEANISDETRQRVVAIAEQMGYVPDAAARALVRGRTQIIGVVVTTLDDPFIGALVQTIESAARDRGYVVILASSSDLPEREIAAAKMLQSRRVDGVIVASSRVGALYKGHLEQPRVPVVLINSLAEPGDELFFSVGVDNRHGGNVATAHLIGKGHRRIAYVASPPDRRDNKERMAGYRQALAGAGIGYAPSLVLQGTGDAAGGQRALPQILSLDNPPSAVVCYNDLTAIGVIDAARRAGLALPRDLAIVGFDDIAFAQYCDPPLTTVAQPIGELGRRAIELMLALLADDAPGAAPGRTVTVRGELIVRASSG
jgi:LacI family transcriptional regulator, repressor for deo operon, udp, cdd, tsx, nupC, and nupG